MIVGDVSSAMHSAYWLGFSQWALAVAKETSPNMHTPKKSYIQCKNDSWGHIFEGLY